MTLRDEGVWEKVLAMTDPYGDAELVELYDLDNPAGADHERYRAIADASDARRILDLGCGTGLLTRSLVRPGRDVIGVDPSATMLAFARRQQGAEAVRWIAGTATAITPTADLDLVLCTGNAFQHIRPDDLSAALDRIAAGLRPGGTVAFDTRNPTRRQWRDWARARTEGERPTVRGSLREWLELVEVDLDDDGEGLVVFDAHNVLDGGADRVIRSELWFRGTRSLERHLGEAGLEMTAVEGDWSGGAVVETSAPLVVQAVRRG